MNKRGQITIFIIIAVLIIASITLFFIFRKSSTTETEKIPDTLSPITEKVQECLDSKLQEGEYLAGLQGGYVLPPNNSIETDFSYIAYGIRENKNVLPNKKEIENQIGRYIELTMPFCENISDSEIYEIKFEEPKAQVNMERNYISVELNYPFSATGKEYSQRINKKYTAEEQIDFYGSYLVAQRIVEKQIASPGFLDLSYLGSFDKDISILDFDSDTKIYSIKSTNTTKKSEIFRFAVQIKNE